MLSVRPQSKLDYSKCDQLITIYSFRSGTYTTTHTKAFYDQAAVASTTKLGTQAKSDFVLIIPNRGNGQPIHVGDKIMLGDGADIATREEWAALNPAKVEGLSIISKVDAKYLGGQIVHWEAC